jgi:hypothetical protein
MRKETGLPDVSPAERSATVPAVSAAPYLRRRDQHEDTDIRHFEPMDSLIEPTDEKTGCSAYGSDMAFPGDVVPVFSFDSFSIKILSLGLLVFLVVAFLAVYP